MDTTKSCPPPDADYEALVEAAAAAHPKLDRWVIEAFVAHYFRGLLNEKGQLLVDPELKQE